ncbi:toxic anion resistance protein [Actinoalloteichus hymeniacidonis]|uniref:Toxic anion resistance protein n=1 Tax=Actinoalloteichus hymeniacidonis TaxID=340345 RepID=A0AAC9HNM2_9PSEU|nr:toxic anion resistance protein [Actinoalloteichus hymeniacidonis]AOS62091.1 hypothetical protein TL08_06330 [Actinoalloteichus hymeniacidonis]MBB5909887.1 uncharacterized protein YaaN involved in tellurite resistance [Actinoalloteichus hymeniacidonis]
MAADDDLVLAPPEPVGPIPPERVAGLIPVSEEDRQAATARAGELADRLAALDVRSPGFGDELERLLTVGEADMRIAASTAGRLIDRSMQGLSDTRLGSDTSQAKLTDSLAVLRRKVVELAPADPGQPRRRLFGLFTTSRDHNALIARYRAAGEPINALIMELRGRQDMLRRDNASLKGERQRLWAAMGRLSDAALFTEAVDEAVERQAGLLELVDPERVTALRSDVLFPLRRRRQDILTQLAVFAQGYLALDLLRRTNDELIRGVDRAVTTTVAALRIALVISAALANQRDVLDEVDALSSVTDGLLRSNSELLATQAEQVRQAGTDPTIAVSTIRESFDRIHRAIDAVDGFRASAVDSMATTVQALSEEIRHSEAYLRRSHEAGLAEDTPEESR